MSENKSGYTVDFTDFNLDFDKLVNETMLDAARKGAFNAMAEMLRDADKEAPQTPKDKGDLRGSKTIEVSLPGMKAEGVKTLRKIDLPFSKEIVVTGGFNIEYAMKVHEAEPGTIRFQVKHAAIQQPGSKFLETKMVRNKEKYMAITALTIKNIMK